MKRAVVILETYILLLAVMTSHLSSPERHGYNLLNLNFFGYLQFTIFAEILKYKLFNMLVRICRDNNFNKFQNSQN